ncbi:MAG: UvrD-helicase domain-containing protein, partial [Chlorobi bacterium]|nr:UvrD-helicase domain-containing protein [Chlorobiota bacterium]
MSTLTPYQLDALNFEKHISLTANAGSGKTFVLARRFLAILLEKDITLDNVVAITFTEKAAAELYKKIADELESRIKENGNDKVIRKLEKIRRQLVSAKISTIHSFCTDLLKEFSPEAGIDANFSPIDNRLSDELITTTIEELISDLMRNESELFDDLKSMIRLFGSRVFVSKHLKSLIARRSIVKKLYTEIYSRGEDEISAYFNETFLEYFHKIFGDEIISIFDRIEQINNVVLQTSKNTDLAEAIKQSLEIRIGNDTFQKILKLNQLFEMMLTNGKIRTRGYLNKNQREEYISVVKAIESFAEEFKVFDFNENYKNSEKQLAKAGLSIMNLWSEALRRYEDKKHQLRYLDFEDLLLVTQDLLKRKDVIEYLSRRYQYFMIDEYQDTNETQYNIFIPILDYLKRGNLFIVGDEKQSIYMFRGADLEIFKKTQDDIKKAADDESLLELPHSFRLSPELTLFTNKLFSRLFEKPNLLYNEVEYNELICAKSSSNKSEVGFLISEKDDASDSESELIAEKILELTQKDEVELKDIAILSRKRKSFTEVEKALIKYKIPYLIYGGKGFFQRQEIYDDVFNYLSFLANPNNDAALIGVLRSPFYTLSDTELFELSLEREESYFEKLKLLSNTKQELRNVYAQLNKHLQLARTMQISMLIREILMDTGYWAVMSSKNNSLQYISNIEKLITAANDFSKQGLRTL